MDDAVEINALVQTLVKRDGGGTIRLEPRVYTLQTPIRRASNITIKGAFRGGNLFDAAVTVGTILKWIGPADGVVIYDGPSDSDFKIDNGGISDLCIDGSGIAAFGLQCMSAYYGHYSNIHCVGVTGHAYYFGTIPTETVSPNYHVRLDDLTACIFGNANGIVLDGTPGSGRNTCFLSARNCHITFQNGVAYALVNCDDCGFLDCACSMILNNQGCSIYFGGSSDGSGRSAYGNRFIGFNCGNHGPIVAEAGTWPSRGNLVITNAVDGVPGIYQVPGSTLTVECYDGEVGLNGFVRNNLPAG